MSKEVVLNDKEQAFIEALLENGGHLVKAAEAAGYSQPKKYAYVLRDRLAEHITKAAHQYMAMKSLRAATFMADSLDSDEPINPVKVTIARDMLDRSGIKPKEEVQQTTVKANIFILPEKREIKAIDVEYENVE